MTKDGNLSKNQELSNVDFSPHTTLHYFLALLIQSKVQELLIYIKIWGEEKKHVAQLLQIQGGFLTGPP